VIGKGKIRAHARLDTAMPHDEGLATRLREILQDQPEIAERKMFGGLAFLADGHMFVGIVGDVLMVRVGPEAYEAALQRKHVRVMDFTGKPMRGYVYVDPPGFARDSDLADWATRARAFVRTLPPKG
jgi:hypothetical protein